MDRDDFITLDSAEVKDQPLLDENGLKAEESDEDSKIMVKRSDGSIVAIMPRKIYNQLKSISM